MTLTCLTAVLASSALGCSASLNDCIHQEVDVDDSVAPIELELHGLSLGIAVGSGGTVLRYVGVSASSQWQALESPTSADLFGIVGRDSGHMIVGAAGTVLSRPISSDEWVTFDLGTTADLFAISLVSTRGAIVGDGVIFWSADGGASWQAASVPDGTGELRGVYAGGTRMIAVGRAGTILMSEDEGASWTALASPSQADLWAVADVGDLLIVGDQGTILRVGEDASIEIVSNSLGGVGDLRALEGDMQAAYAVGRDGLIVDLLAEGGPLVLESDPARGDLWGVETEPYEGASVMLAVGAGGRVTRLVNATIVDDSPACSSIVVGRPLRIAGAARVAPVVGRDDWQRGPTPAIDDLSDAMREQLAALWSRDAAFEHASVASFARHALELMALAAPPELLGEVARAQLDEIEHARLCFSLASAYAGRHLGPDVLALDELGREPLTDPLTVARELFVSGCLNETFAALEAARAAELARDAQVAEVLERIATDEARHAALAWRTLAWLVRRDAEVARWLPRALDELRLPALPSPGSDDALLASHGRVSARERASLQREAITTIVRPALLALLRTHTDDQAACASACQRPSWPAMRVPMPSKSTASAGTCG